MKHLFIYALILVTGFSINAQEYTGFYDFNYDNETGYLNLKIKKEQLNELFLYQTSLSSGLGSNDIGLDRGKLGETRVVYFEKTGNRILFKQKNTKFRALSDNVLERKAVEDAFSFSVLYSFKILQDSNDYYTVNLGDFLMNDHYGVAKVLDEKKQGKYRFDTKRSAIYLENTKSFPKNSEFEMVITLTGKADGSWIKGVSEDANIISTRQHHSFVELPDDNYKPRAFKASCGYYPLSFVDYASPLNADMTVRYITRHRLELDNNGKVIEPIVYYLDSGCPEPVRSALLEGARWWEEAFEKAGFKNGFRVEMLPDDADPLDVRYNVIQWVHRQTRGWSYGASVTDPRTGEIIKGHVSLGSLRVRQDFMIAQGILSNLDENERESRMQEMALARLRQLSAHEVGHTIGLTHNFAASVNDRASVMDYPHPIINAVNNELDFNNSYDTKIGSWDIRAIIYGYSNPKSNQSESEYLNQIIKETEDQGYLFITDQDARPKGGIHPYAHLWDNGSNPLEELNRIKKLRQNSLDNFDSGALSKHRPLSELEKVLVPVYLMHRYQVDATSKMISGIDYDYSINTFDNNKPFNYVDPSAQRSATKSILETISSEFLSIPDHILAMIPPPAFGYKRTREVLKGKTGLQFDPLSSAEAAANYSLDFLLEPTRLNRLLVQNQKDWGITDYLELIESHIFSDKNDLISMSVEKLLVMHYLKLIEDTSLLSQTTAIINDRLNQLNLSFGTRKQKDKNLDAHKAYLRNMIRLSQDPENDFQFPSIPKMPPGSPIGCG